MTWLTTSWARSSRVEEVVGQYVDCLERISGLECPPVVESHKVAVGGTTGTEANVNGIGELDVRRFTSWHPSGEQVTWLECLKAWAKPGRLSVGPLSHDQVPQSGLREYFGTRTVVSFPTGSNRSQL